MTRRGASACERGRDGRDRSAHAPPAAAAGAVRARSGRRYRALLATGVAIGMLLGPGEQAAWAGALLPERGGSPNADRIASLYTVVLVLAALVFAGVAAMLVFALVRYRERRSPVAAQIRGNTRLEIAWTVAAAGLIVFLAVFSILKLDAIEHPGPAVASPAAAAAGVGDGGPGALHIDVVGRQYVWLYKYPNGAFSYEEMVAPVGVTVQLDIVSVDVAHSWWIPKLGGKFDALPGYVNHTWFRLEEAGVYTGQCAELCGRNHAKMVARVRGVAPAAYARWVARQKRLIDAANATAAREHRATAPGGP
jgi:cytochrome c oxidase subunit II